MEPFFARIIPVGAGADQRPPGIWGGANEPFPTPPIVIIPPTEPGKPPLVIWGGPGSLPPWVMPPIALPPIIWPQPPEGGPPIVIDPPHPEHPIVLPPLPPIDPAHPAHPIVIPLPPEIWPRPGHPAHPIVIPPEEGSPPAVERPIDWQVGWTEQTGWVVVGIPQVPHPAPSRREERRK